MFQRLEDVEKKYVDLTEKISNPEIINQQNEWRTYMKEHAEIEPIVIKYREYKKVKQQYEDAKEMLNDPELKDLAEIEMLENKEKLPQIEEELKILLIPKDPDDDKNVICEIRAGTGGDEAALFAGTLFRMYNMFCERKHWKLEILNENETGLGGYKEISFMITGKGVYSRMKFESGTHRVQRVPDTESSGRIHTSTATVAVLPEVDEVDIEIRQEDLKIDVFRASGNGGQCVNTTDSAVRMTHLPTGIVVSCQDEKSQIKNKEKALKVLRARLYEKAEAERHEGIAEDRRSQVGTGDRSERIRTYNYPQGRVTDHRIGLTLYKLDTFLDGEIDEILNALITADQAEKMKNMGNTVE